jgi:hypothetical protein
MFTKNDSSPVQSWTRKTFPRSVILLYVQLWYIHTYLHTTGCILLTWSHLSVKVGLIDWDRCMYSSWRAWSRRRRRGASSATNTCRNTWGITRCPLRCYLDTVREKLHSTVTGDIHVTELAVCPIQPSKRERFCTDRQTHFVVSTWRNIRTYTRK